MAIPSFITSTVSSIAGEYTLPGETIGFDASHYPADLLSIADPSKLPTINEFQKEMLTTMLGESGRSELFSNPFSDDLDSLRQKLNELIASSSSPSDGDTGGVGENPVKLACEDLLETFTHFESHTDRLCGLVEPVGDDAEFPTLERALAVGNSLNHASALLDENPTNGPQLSMFSSIFAGRQQFDRLKDMLNTTADSNLLASTISDISQKLVSYAENDVANYTVGLKKLQRLGVANMVFASRDRQVESELFELITSDYTRGLFDGDNSRRNEEEVSRQQRRLDAARLNRANTTSTNGGTGNTSMSTSFGEVAELIRENGLFEGIEMNVGVYNKLVNLYPPTTLGHFNNYLAGLSRLASPMTAEVLDEYFASENNKEQFLLMLFRDILAKSYSTSTIWPGRGDVFFDGVRKFGSISKIIVFAVFSGERTDPNLAGKLRVVIQEFDGGPWRECNASEEAIMKEALATNIGHPLVGRIFLDLYGQRVGYYFWKGSTFSVPNVFPPLPYPN